MSRLRRSVTTVPVMALLFTGAAMVSTAEAAPGPQCGDTITQTTTLTHDIGPCPAGVDGLDVTASNITLNLNGHSITGSNTHEVAAAGEQVQQIGVHLLGVSGVVVTNGTVQHFDAGVAIEGGARNTISNLSVLNNVNHQVFTGVTSRVDFCDYGDGVVADNSSNNRIENNRLAHNGPFDGIALVDNSDNNKIIGNELQSNDVRNDAPPGPFTPNGGTLCGAGFTTGGPGGTGPMSTGRGIQDSGIRIEGPGADGNVVQSNTVQNSALYGIGIHPYACHAAPGAPNGQPNNGGNLIKSNTVSGTGKTTHNDDPVATGIGVFENGPSSIVCASSGNTIESNTSSNNFQDGIQLGGRGAHDNVVRDNTANGNTRDGIRLSGPSGPGGSIPGAVNDKIVDNHAKGNGEFDGADFTFVPPCDSNLWKGNQFRTVNQPCVAGHGGTGTVQQLMGGLSASGAFGNTSAKTLSVGFSSQPITVTNPAGFTIYTSRDCSTPATGTGQSATTMNNVATVTLDHAPNNTMAYKVAAGSVTSNGVSNAAVPCTTL